MIIETAKEVGIVEISRQTWYWSGFFGNTAGFCSDVGKPSWPGTIIQSEARRHVKRVKGPKPLLDF